MNNEITVQFTGVEQLDVALARLANVEREKAVRAGLRKGGAYLIRKGRARLRSGLHSDNKHQYRTGGRKPGNLQTSFVNKVKRATPGVLVGFKRPAGAHSHLVDLGTSQRETHGGRNRGVMPGIKFWTDTREHGTGTALETVMQGIEAAVINIMR